MKQLSIPNIIMLVVVILVTIGAVVGVILGVTTGSQEAGLLDVCWSGRQALYDSSECSVPEHITWDRERMPLLVVGPDDDQLRSAIDLVNDQIGCGVLFLDQNIASDQADVVIVLDSAMEVGRDEPGGATSHSRIQGGVQQAFVDIMAVGDPHMKMRVIVHELGHVLGLAHDDFPASIMYPSQRQTTDLQFTMLTDHDQELLHGLYCD